MNSNKHIDNNPPISITEIAATRIKAFLQARGQGLGLRLGVVTSGCSGLAYKLEFADKVNVDDCDFLSNGVRVLVDAKSLTYLKGMTLDYTKEQMKEGFKFINPNVKNECGCGESFEV